MSTEVDQARLIAERIAKRFTVPNTAPSDSSLSRSDVGSEIASVRAALSEMQARVSQLEAKIRNESTVSGEYSQTAAAPTARRFTPATHSPWLAGVNAAASHASEERFGIEEATINELVDFFQTEKTCSLDPSGKPCDHCAMCSSRGF